MIRLEEILENKRREIRELKNLHGDHVFHGNQAPHSFQAAVRNSKNLALIAEIKRMSPSRGILNNREPPLEIAELYGNSGADAVSVLTDQKYFGGSYDFLKEISEKIKIPALCKDFILDRLQIDLAKVSGAAAVLLITDILNDSELKDLYDYSKSSGLDALVEAHSPGNIRRAVQLNAEIVGINNRDLFSFEEDKNHAVRNIGLIPEDRIRLCLSSIQTIEDGTLCAECGFDGILVGSALMQSNHKEAAVKSFKTIPRKK